MKKQMLQINLKRETKFVINMQRETYRTETECASQEEYMGMVQGA